MVPLVPKLRLGMPQRSETAFRRAGVSAGRRLRDTGAESGPRGSFSVKTSPELVLFTSEFISEVNKLGLGVSWVSSAVPEGSLGVSVFALEVPKPGGEVLSPGSGAPKAGLGVSVLAAEAPGFDRGVPVLASKVPKLDGEVSELAVGGAKSGPEVPKLPKGVSILGGGVALSRRERSTSRRERVLWMNGAMFT